MRVRLGYVSISKTLNITSSGSVTYKKFSEQFDYKLIDKVVRSNLENLIEILKYNTCNNIHFYRLSSSIIPLATYDKVNFDYYKGYECYYEEIGRIINNSGMRVDMHASNFCILNSVRDEVVCSSNKCLEYYYNLLKYMNIDKAIVVLHIGSSALGKEKSIERFINNFNSLPEYLRKMIVLENDDKVFNISDVINISDCISVPIVLDYHHHLCNSAGDIRKYLPKIMDSWKDGIVKMHFSTSKNKREIRAHSDYINVSDFISFLDIIHLFDRDIDIMIEAKGKDEALFRLMRELKYKTNYKFIDETSFIV